MSLLCTCVRVRACMCVCVCVTFTCIFRVHVYLPYYTESARFSPVFGSRLRQQESDKSRHIVTPSPIVVRETYSYCTAELNATVPDEKETRRSNQLTSTINFSAWCDKMSNDIALESEDVSTPKWITLKNINKRDQTNERACFNVYQCTNTNN